MANVTTELKVLVKAVGKGELKELEASLNKLAVTARTKVDVNFKKVSAELKKIQSTSTTSIKNLRDYRNAWRDIAAQLDISSKEFKEATAEAARLDAQLAKTERRRSGGGGGGGLRAGAQIAGTVAGAGVFGGPEGAAGALIGSIGGTGGAIIGGAIGAQVGQLRKAAAGVGEYVAQLNLAKATLGGVSTDLVDYNKNLEFTRRISSDYGLTLQGVIKGFAGVTAAARANNLSTEQTQKIYEGMAASGIAFGKSQEDLQAIFLATVQVLSKGKASAEEISGQIGERIPGAVAKFAAATKRTLPELAKAFKDGEVTIADFVLFAEKQGDDYAEFAKSLASGPEKAGIRLEIALNKMKEAYGGLFLGISAALSDSLTALANYVDGNKEQFQRLLAETAAFAEGLIRVTVTSVAAIMTILEPLIKAVKFVTKALINFDGIPFTGPTQLEKDILQEQYGGQAKGQLSPEAQKFMDMMIDFIPSQFANAAAAAATPLNLGLDGSSGDGGGATSQMKTTSQELFDLALARNQAFNDGNEILLAELNFQIEIQKLTEQFNAGQKDFNTAQIEALAAEEKFKKTGLRLLKKEREGYRDRTKDQKEFKKELTETEKMLNSIKDTLATGIANAIEGLIDGTKTLSQCLAGVLKQMASMFIQSGISSLIGGLFPGGGGASKGIAQAVGGFAANGAYFDRGVAKFANGGIVDKPTMFAYANGGAGRFGLMGEAGPEAIMPLRRGANGKLGIESSGVGASNVVVNVDASGSSVEGDGDQAAQLGKMLGAAVQAELIKQKRPGGLLAS